MGTIFNVANDGKVSFTGAIKIADGTQTAGYVLTSDVDGLATWQANSGVLTPGTLINTYPVGNNPRAIAFDGTYIWIANTSDNTVTKLLASSGAVASGSPFTVGTSPCAITFDGIYIWTANFGSANVTKLLASDGSTVGTYSAGSNPFGITFDGTYIWVTDFEGVVTKLLAADGSIVGAYFTGTHPQSVAFDGTYIWVANSGASSVTKLLAADGSFIETITVGNNPQSIAFDGTYIWVANANGIVTKIVASSGASVGSFSIGHAPQGIAYDGASIWVTNSSNHSVTYMSASDGSVIGTFQTGHAPYSVTFDGKSIWITNSSDNSVTKLANVSPLNPIAIPYRYALLSKGLAVPSGEAGGSLSGTYPNPTVTKIGNVDISGVPASGKILIASSSTAAAWTSPTTPQWQSFTIPYSSFTAASPTQSITLFSLPAGSVIHNTIISHTTSFIGGALSAYTLGVGIIGNTTKYASAFNVFQAPSGATGQISNFVNYENSLNPTTIFLSAFSTGDNVNAATQGSVLVKVLVSQAF